MSPNVHRKLIQMAKANDIAPTTDLSGQSKQNGPDISMCLVTKEVSLLDHIKKIQK